MASDETAEEQSNLEKRHNELGDKMENPVHKRLIKIYRRADPKKSMEEELGKILLEVLHRED